jgi:hypothetical protein
MRLHRWMTTMLVVAALPAIGFAQTDQGKFTGTVLDSTGGFVGGATVTVRNERTGEERTQTTSNAGVFLIANLKPSSYTVRATKDGFAAVEYTQLPIAVGQELHLDFEFRPAGVQEAVTVVGQAPILDLSSARIGANVSERDVVNLPVNGRQMSQLLLQAPGSLNAGTGTWQDIRFSGRAVEQNAIRYDGIEGSAIIDAAPGNLNGEVATPFKLQASLENVQEFRVESSVYPAEFGTGSGGQVSVITKSGSNNLRGSAFEYLRSDKFDAPNFFDTNAGLPKSLLKQNQFGGSLGGPIAKNRAFFFGSYEAYRLKAGVNIVEAVPSAAAWARAVPAIAALRPGFLAAGAVILPRQSTNPDFDIAQLQTPAEVQENAYSGRFDFKMTNRWSSYVRVFGDRGVSDQPDSVSGRVVHTEANNGATGLRHFEQEYYIGYAQAEWHATPKFTLNYGVRYDYYTVPREANNLQVKFNVDTGVIDPPTTPVLLSTTTNFQPRVGATYAVSGRTVVRGGFGLFVGPGQTEDQIQTIADSDRVSVTLSSGANLAFPLDSAAATNTFINSPNNRAYQPRAYRNEYRIPERIWQYTGSVQQEVGRNLVATAAYVGSQGRNLFLQHCQSHRPGGDQPESCERRVCDPQVLDRAARRRRRCHRRAESVCRNRHEDQRRPRQLQCDAARLVAPLGKRPLAECPVHALAKLREHERLERSADGRQRGADAAGVQLRPRIQRVRRPAYVQLQRALLNPVRPRAQKSRQRCGRYHTGQLGRRRHRERTERAAYRRSHHAP